MASYKIKSGDTLGKLAAKYNTSVSRLMELNPSISNKNRIFAGSTIQVPGGGGGGGGGVSNEDRLAYGFGTDFLNANKAIKNLVDKAVKNEYTPERFADELRQTGWWKNKSDAQRRYELSKVENPGELASSIGTAKDSVKNLSVRLGVYLTGAQVTNIATSWVKNDLSESEVRNLVGKKYTAKSSGNAMQRGTAGAAGAARAQLNEAVRNYGMTFSRKWLTGATRNIARGVRTVSDYEGYIREQAARQFKAIAPDIREGRTVREILDPYMNMAAEELGLSPTIMNTTAAKWLKPVSGQEQMTMDDWVRTIRSNKSYGYDNSRNAQRQASIMAQELMSTMGAV